MNIQNVYCQRYRIGTMVEETTPKTLTQTVRGVIVYAPDRIEAIETVMELFQVTPDQVIKVEVRDVSCNWIEI